MESTYDFSCPHELTQQEDSSLQFFLFVCVCVKNIFFTYRLCLTSLGKTFQTAWLSSLANQQVQVILGLKNAVK